MCRTTLNTHSRQYASFTDFMKELVEPVAFYRTINSFSAGSWRTKTRAVSFLESTSALPPLPGINASRWTWGPCEWKRLRKTPDVSRSPTPLPAISGSHVSFGAERKPSPTRDTLPCLTGDEDAATRWARLNLLLESRLERVQFRRPVGARAGGSHVGHHGRANAPRNHGGH